MSPSFLQMALLRWLSTQTDEDRTFLAAVTGVQVGRELLNRFTGQDKVDAYKVPACCLQGAPSLDQIQTQCSSLHTDTGRFFETGVYSWRIIL